MYDTILNKTEEIIECEENMMKMRKAVGAIIKKDEKYILVHKVKNSHAEIKLPANGVWDFVKGGVEEGENIRYALAREIKEELGSNQFEVLEKLGESLAFLFSNEQKNNKYDGQITYFFLLEFLGALDEIRVDHEEIQEVGLFDANEVIDQLTHAETRRYFERNVLK